MWSGGTRKDRSSEDCVASGAFVRCKFLEFANARSTHKGRRNLYVLSFLYYLCVFRNGTRTVVVRAREGSFCEK